MQRFTKENMIWIKNKDKELPVNKNAESDKRPFIAGNWIKLVVWYG